MADIPGEQDLRAEDVDEIVKNYALEQNITTKVRKKKEGLYAPLLISSKVLVY